MLRFRVPSAVLLAGVSALFAVLSGCSDGGGGDAEPKHNPDVLGSGERISEVNTRPVRPTEEEIVYISGARIAHIDTFDETGEGQVGNVFLSDFTENPGPNEGILLYGASYSPPSFRPRIGDVVDVSANYSEFRIDLSFIPEDFTTPELTGGRVTERFDAVSEIPPPIVAVEPLSDTATEDEQINTFEGVVDLIDYKRGRPWLSMLVTMENVKVAEGLSVDKAGRASVVLAPPNGVSIDGSLRPTITNELFDLGGSGLDIQSGATIKRVTGYVTLFSHFQIAPRSAADIELGP
ncbi:MAG: hypothetical protein U0165_08450 [Polyangiaceae bacterium]